MRTFEQVVGIGDTIAVWFSSGAASAVAAKRTIQRYAPIANIRVINNPVAEEHEDNLRFLKDVEQWLGVPIEFAINDEYPSYSAREVWERRKYMSGTKGAPCTSLLKKRARQQWEACNWANWHVLGFTHDEKKRYEKFILSEKDNVVPILIDDMLTKQDCINILEREGIRPPIMYELGYPNANCIGCVKATSASYWNLVRQTHPDIFLDRAKQSRELGVRLVRYEGVRMFLDELPNDAQGRPIKKMNIECGIFCEEKPDT